MEREPSLIGRALRTAFLPVGMIEYVFRRRDASGDIYPIDEPRGFVSGPDPDRVVVIGEGTAVGLGTTTHELGMAAQFSRHWTVKTGRGTGWTALAVPDSTVRRAAEFVEEQSALFASTDLVIVMLGIKDTLQVTRRSAWRDRLGALLDALDAALPADARVVITEIPPMDNAGSISRAARLASGHHARQLNEITREVLLGRASCTLSAFPDDLRRELWLPESRQAPYARMYRTWSASVSSLLSATTPTVCPNPAVPQ